MVFQFLALIVSMLIISLLILKGLHPILSVLVGCSLMCWTNGLPYASTFASGLATWGSALMPTIFVTLLGGTLGVLIPPSIMMILYGSLTGNSIAPWACCTPAAAASILWPTVL